MDAMLTAPTEADSADLFQEIGSPIRPYGVGIDTHSRFIQVCVIVLHHGRCKLFEREFATSWPELINARSWSFAVLRKHSVVPDDLEWSYCIESTGCYHLPVLRAFKGRPEIVNPMLAGSTRRKTDVLDARMLARQNMCGLWSKSFVPDGRDHSLRVLLGMRRECVRNATRAINRINNNVLRFGHTLGAAGSLDSPAIRPIVEDMCKGVVAQCDHVCPTGLPVEVRGFFQDAYGIRDSFRELVNKYTRESRLFADKSMWPTEGGFLDGKTLLANLATVPGIGEISALTWLSEIGDPRRFKFPKQVAAFCGCDPSLKVSAGKVTSQARRKGNKRVHSVLKNAAARIVREHTCKLGMWGFSMMRRHGKKGWHRAINAVSRRMAIFLWHVHRTGKPFDEARYSYYLAVPVRDVPLDQMDVPEIHLKKIRALGFRTSGQIAEALQTTLPQEKGIGEGCLKALHTWIQNNRQPTQSRKETVSEFLGTSPKGGEKSSRKTMAVPA